MTQPGHHIKRVYQKILDFFFNQKSQMCRPQIRECNWKLFFLFLNQNICCGYSKEPSQWDGSFEHPKYMFKLIDKKIIAILHLHFLLNWPYDKKFTCQYLVIHVCTKWKFLSIGLIPYKPNVLFVGHRQTVQTQIRCHRMIRVSERGTCIKGLIWPHIEPKLKVAFHQFLPIGLLEVEEWFKCKILAFI